MRHVRKLEGKAGLVGILQFYKRLTGYVQSTGFLLCHEAEGTFPHHEHYFGAAGELQPGIL